MAVGRKLRAAMRGATAIVALLLFCAVAASGVFMVALERLAGRGESRATQRLAACLEDHMVPDVSVEGEALIERACRERGRAPAQAQAQCILSHTEELANPDRAAAIAQACKVEMPID